MSRPRQARRGQIRTIYAAAGRGLTADLHPVHEPFADVEIGRGRSSCQRKSKSMTCELLRFLLLLVLAVTSAIVPVAWAGKHFETKRVRTCGHDGFASCDHDKPIH
jgi:hypothetical protein